MVNALISGLMEPHVFTLISSILRHAPAQYRWLEEVFAVLPNAPLRTAEDAWRALEDIDNILAYITGRDGRA